MCVYYYFRITLDMVKVLEESKVKMNVQLLAFSGSKVRRAGFDFAVVGELDSNGSMIIPLTCWMGRFGSGSR